MKDFRVIRTRSLLTVSAIAPIRGFLPVSILATGKELGQASEIFYNGAFVEEFVVDAPDRLIIRVPSSQVGKNLQELRVYSDTPRPGESVGISLEIVGPLRRIEGIERLVQTWLLVFFTTPGSSIFHPGSGGGARKIIGRTSSTSEGSRTADLAMAVETTQSEVLRRQSTNRQIPPSERLLSSKLESVFFDPTTTSISGRVSLRNMLGENVEFSI